MTHLALAAAIAGLIASPALAQTGANQTDELSEPLTCANFTSLASPAQEDTMKSINNVGKAKAKNEIPNASPPDDALSVSAVSACQAYPDLTVDAAMKKMQERK